MERKGAGRCWCAGRGHGGKDSSAENPGLTRLGSGWALLPVFSDMVASSALSPSVWMWMSSLSAQYQPHCSVLIAVGWSQRDSHHGRMTLLFIFTEQLSVCEGAQRQNCRHDCSVIRGIVYTASKREKICRDTRKSPEQGLGRETGQAGENSRDSRRE